MYIYNSSLKLCYFPKEWKHAVVVPIPKPGKDPSNPSNYRPISLLSSISKVFERIILKRLNTFVSTQKVLPNHQFGFRAAHSTSYQLNRVVWHVTNMRSQGQSTGMLGHHAIFHKLFQGGCNIFIARIIHSFQVDPSRPSVIFHLAYLRVPFYL
jgi:hypothetical protein